MISYDYDFNQYVLDYYTVENYGLDFEEYIRLYFDATE